MISVPHKSTLLGLDVHKLTIAAGVLAGLRQSSSGSRLT